MTNTSRNWSRKGERENPGKSSSCHPAVKYHSLQCHSLHTKESEPPSKLAFAQAVVRGPRQGLCSKSCHSAWGSCDSRLSHRRWAVLDYCWHWLTHPIMGLTDSKAWLSGIGFMLTYKIALDWTDSQTETSTTQLTNVSYTDLQESAQNCFWIAGIYLSTLDNLATGHQRWSCPCFME